MLESPIASARAVALDEAFELAARFRDLRYVQHPGYAIEAARAVGARVEFLAIEDNGEAIGFAAARLKTLPVFGFGLAYVHRGPTTIFAEGQFDADRWGRCVEALVRHYRPAGHLLRISSPLWCDEEDALTPYYRGLGFVRTPAGGRTIVMDLAPSLEELRGQLHAKWRSHLNKSLRADLTVTRSTGLAEFDRFQPLLANLAERKRFRTVQDACFFGAAAQHGGADDIVLHLAWQGDELVAGHVGTYTGDTAVYVLGANTPAGRDVRASYFLQWQVIEYAKSRGITFYDLGGIDPRANPDVYHFKARMGGREVAHAAQWELATGLVAPPLVRLAEKARAALSRR
ncbi:peptidoglycan bridge formation glycyltransferase FemA/FemB family protein [Sphingomonas sp. MAH-20]|uniref:Peptidoglycan bridge formation glycyltransferase FemA/FemB family protein n=1 Tax=Sphingomonas horti TaxID=2682842 RepID=A0A6I4J8E0_9SPHN|nr:MULTISPECIES: peptidoglycan bridge formation glycyltransferase FemA/FemB family protein [Sphingomonas]MBA2919038.1 peptidoglycan bridge formation glycyltransferase FemA/FemB family protein [Sphingomonas sp. CGMCC 1.13658]MVO79071.1 peptidoglycan bridge formation glycyltransferase FemA/FemB family protein [Sphingomonas horti]